MTLVFYLESENSHSVDDAVLNLKRFVCFMYLVGVWFLATFQGLYWQCVAYTFTLISITEYFLISCYGMYQLITLCQYGFWTENEKGKMGGGVLEPV